jgi:hypothetical protein
MVRYISARRRFGKWVRLKICLALWILAGLVKIAKVQAEVYLNH